MTARRGRVSERAYSIECRRELCHQLMRFGGCRGSNVLDHGMERDVRMREPAVVAGAAQIDPVELYGPFAPRAPVVIMHPPDELRVLSIVAKAPGERSAREILSVAGAASNVVVYRARLGEGGL